MKKRILILGTQFLFIVLLLNPMVICYNVKILDKELNGDPTPPDQPTSGPGGSDYSHAGVKKSKYKSGAEQFWIFEPTDPTPATAPLIVFLHAWFEIFPFPHIVWIKHIVKHGNIVVYPIYQRNIFGDRQFTSNAITEVKHAIQELQQGNHVRPYQKDKRQWP